MIKKYENKFHYKESTVKYLIDFVGCLVYIKIEILNQSLSNIKISPKYRSFWPGIEFDNRIVIWNLQGIGELPYGFLEPYLFTIKKDTDYENLTLKEVFICFIEGLVENPVINDIIMKPREELRRIRFEGLADFINDCKKKISPKPSLRELAYRIRPEY